MTDVLCAECRTPITEHERECGDVEEHNGEEYHWSCLQEYYERQRLAKEDLN